jgi:hypothetical protein
MWDNGNMDGACKVEVYLPNCNKPAPPKCPDTNYSICPAMTYVQDTEWDTIHSYYILDPYFQIAEQYGWANYMFQTNQGPSFPAHQFLFTGTSAPIQYGDANDPCEHFDNNLPCWEWFDEQGVNSTTAVNGCTAAAGAYAYQIDPKSKQDLPPNPIQVNGINLSNGFPCYDHPTLSDLLEGGDPTREWKYYGRGAGDIWTAPNAINHICMTTGYGGKCTGSSWQANVAAVLPDRGGYDSAPILDDIANCNLSHVSWVIPDGNWSDHNQAQPGDGGPSWVAAIVNAIGQDKTCEGGKGYWSDTVILITWDDWGGLYDDVLPPDCPGPGKCTGYSNLTGGQYVYGFRVPLLVVSAYTKQVTPQGGYISGPQNNPTCPNYYCHDFGSILNFIEYAFGTGGNPLGYPGGISPSYHYADFLAMDYNPNQQGSYSLSDFFDFGQQPRAFTPITGAKYQPICFHTPKATGCFGSSYPSDPDNDANESD